MDKIMTRVFNESEDNTANCADTSHGYKNEIIPLHYREGKQQPYIDSRELHQFLEIRKPHSDWIKYKIEQEKFVENKDYVTFSQRCDKPQGGRPAQIYGLSLHTAITVCVNTHNQKGKEARDFLIEQLHILKNANLHKSACTTSSMPTEINGDFIIAIGEQMNKLQQSLTLAEKVIEDNADILSGKDAAGASDMLFHIRDFVKFTGDSRVPNKLKEHAFREQLIKDGLIYTKYNSNQKEYYPKAIASKWFIAKLSSTTVNTRNGRKQVTGVTLQMNLKGVCWALVRYGGATQKDAQQIIAEATGNDNRNLTAGSPKSSATPARNPLEPTQFVENGVVKPIETKI